MGSIFVAATFTDSDVNGWATSSIELFSTEDKAIEYVKDEIKIFCKNNGVDKEERDDFLEEVEVSVEEELGAEDEYGNRLYYIIEEKEIDVA